VRRLLTSRAAWLHHVTAQYVTSSAFPLFSFYHAISTVADENRNSYTHTHTNGTVEGDPRRVSLLCCTVTASSSFCFHFRSSTPRVTTLVFSFAILLSFSVTSTFFFWIFGSSLTNTKTLAKEGRNFEVGLSDVGLHSSSATLHLSLIVFLPCARACVCLRYREVSTNLKLGLLSFASLL
jgi:hypothetical protein